VCENLMIVIKRTRLPQSIKGRPARLGNRAETGHSRPTSGDTFQSRRVDRRRLFGISRGAADLLAMNAQLLFFFAAPQRFELAAGNDPGYEVPGDNLKGV
jgi:hypothetical protein